MESKNGPERSSEGRTALRVAVIGSGISGISAAYHLQNFADDLVIFEGSDRLGGHTDTHSLLLDRESFEIDSGFIVFNDKNYPGFSSWLKNLGVLARSSDMSFGVKRADIDFEYGTGSINAIFAQKLNLFSSRFWRMLWDIVRFYGSVEKYDLEQLTLGQLVEKQGYSRGFWEDHLLPMCGALWSLPPRNASQIPANHVIQFMRQHRMLQLFGRPEWQVVQGGSSRYIKAFVDQFPGTIFLNDAVKEVQRLDQKISISSSSGEHIFDKVIFACHGDEALKILSNPSSDESRVLGAFKFQKNTVFIHGDESVMPINKKAWSSWNVTVDKSLEARCQITYWMNSLQKLTTNTNVFVTLNPNKELNSVFEQVEYSHPMFTEETEWAQPRRGIISGANNIHYCGAYWSWGFHEDGFSTGKACADEIARNPQSV
tara:strand:- start:340 stop:1626 length:1287 start_codon:yes stop_codon:yes gene_type:complete